MTAKKLRSTLSKLIAIKICLFLLILSAEYINISCLNDICLLFGAVTKSS